MNTLDHCYTKIKSAYKSFQRAGLGNSDHSVVLLLPNYKQRVRLAKPVSTAVSQWTMSAAETLQDCFNNTNWNAFRDTWTTLDEYTETVLDYLKFCEDVCVPKKTVTRYANSKPWFDKNIRKKIVAKDRAL